MKKYFYYVFYFIVSILFFQGCKPSEEPFEEQDIPNFYGVEFNPEREKIGLPILPDNWRKSVKVRDTIYQIWWYSPNGRLPLPRYSEKRIWLNKDTIIRETNEYTGSQEFIEVDHTYKEKLFITYHFVQKEPNEVRWKYLLKTGIKRTCTSNIKIEPYACVYMEDFQITKETADSILTSWGLPDKSIDEHKVEKRSLIKSVKEFVKRKMPKFVIVYFFHA